MRRLRRCVGLTGLLLATACGSPDAGPDTTLSAAGAAGAEPATIVTSSTTVPTTVPATTVVPTTTVRAAAPATTAATTARRTGPPPAPAPSMTIPAGTVPTIPIDTVVAVTTTVTEGSTVANVRAVREQYLGEKVYVWVEAKSTERITSIKIDFGDGYVTTDAQTLPSTLLTAGTMSAGTTRAHVYPAAGRYRMTVTLTVLPGLAAPALTGPPTELQWIPSGPDHAVTVRADVLQRPDAAPPGYPRLPPMMSE